MLLTTPNLQPKDSDRKNFLAVPSQPIFMLTISIFILEFRSEKQYSLLKTSLCTEP